MSLFDDLAAGRLANLDAVLWAGTSTIDRGGAAGTRAVDVAPWDGISCRIHLDRGLDIGRASFRGVPIAWISAVGEAGPRDDLEGMAWGAAFGGGLVTTCGLRNVGMPSEGHGLHGTYSHLPAADLRVEREVSPDGAAAVVSGTVVDDADPVPLGVRRTIRVAAGAGRIDLEDVAANLGDEPTPAPLLYHCNFGYPLWAPPARLEMPVVATEARDPESRVAVDTWHLPPPVAEGPERVLEHTLDPDLDRGWARVVNPALGVAVTVSWDRAGLPRLNQWLDPNPGMAVLGVEPANCTTRGRASDRSAGILPILEPGARRVTRLRVEASAT